MALYILSDCISLLSFSWMYFGRKNSQSMTCISLGSLWVQRCWPNVSSAGLLQKVWRYLKRSIKLPQRFCKEWHIFSTLSLQGTSLVCFVVLPACLYCFSKLPERHSSSDVEAVLRYYFFPLSISSFFFPESFIIAWQIHFFMLLGTHCVTHLCWNGLQCSPPSSCHTLCAAVSLESYVCGLADP